MSAACATEDGKAAVLGGVDRSRTQDCVDLCIGDFNTGNNDMDKDPKGARFVDPDARSLDRVRLRRRVAVKAPGIREYSWFSPGAANNGFRIDHAYAAPELAQRVIACEFDQTPRLLRETDHAALIVSFGTFLSKRVLGRGRP